MNRIARIVVPPLALLVLVAVVIGIPLVLVATVGWPLPSPLPTSAEVGDILAGRAPIPTDHVIGLLALVLWVLWAQVAWATAVEVVAAARGRLARRTMVLPGLQTLIGRLVAAAALIGTSLVSKPVVAQPLPAVVTTAGPEPMATPTGVGLSSAKVGDERGPKSYMTQPGDTWWGVAEQSLGSGTRWKEIRGLNLGRTMNDGTTITNSTDLLKPRWRLLLPAAAVTEVEPVPTGAGRSVASTVETAAAANTQGPDRQVTVRAGDSIWGIASDDLGGDQVPTVVADHVDDITDLNQESLQGNPDLIHPGQTLSLPPRPGMADGPDRTVTPDPSADSPDAGESSARADTAVPDRIDPPAPVTPADADGLGAADDDAGADGVDADAGSTRTSPLAGARAEAPGTDPTEADPTRPDGEPTRGGDAVEPARSSSQADDDESAAGGEPTRQEIIVVEADASSEVGASRVQTTADLGTGGRIEGRNLGGISPVEPGTPVARPVAAGSAAGREAAGSAAGQGAAGSAAGREAAVDVAAGGDESLDGTTRPGADSGSDGSDTLDADDADGSEVAAEDGLSTGTGWAPIYAGLAGLTLVGAYLHRARGRRRDTTMRSRHPGRRPVKPKSTTRVLARRFSAAAEAEHPEFVNIGLRALGRQLTGTAPNRLPEISGVWVSHNRMVVAFDENGPRLLPPAPFTEFADGSGWSLHRRDLGEAREIAEGANGPLPLLTTLGTTSALDLALTTGQRAPADAYGMSASLLYAVDLEPGRVISIEGDSEVATIQTMTTMALELATSETADQAEIVCVGFGHRLATLERVVVVDDLTQILSDLETITSRAVYASTDASPFATRVGDGAADTWNPVVVFHVDGSDPEASTLVDLADRTDGGVTAVCGYPAGTGWTFRLGGGRINCPDLPGPLSGHEFDRYDLDDTDGVADFLDEPLEQEPLGDDFWSPMGEPLSTSDLGTYDWDHSPLQRSTGKPGAADAGAGRAEPWEGGDDDDSWRPMRRVAEADAQSTSGGEDDPADDDDSSFDFDPDRFNWDDDEAYDEVGESGLADGPSGERAEQPRLRSVPAADDTGGRTDGGTSSGDETSGDPTTGLRHSIEHRPTDGKKDTIGPNRSSAMIESVRAVTPPVRSPRRLPGGDAENDTENGRRRGEVSRRTDEVGISVLGNFTIEGHHLGDRKKPWKYTKTPELILYLLLHPAGAGQDLLMEELFPEQPANRPRLNQLISDARTKALGQDSAGEYYLPHASPTEPFYRLSPRVGFDLRDFALHCSRAKGAVGVDEQEEAWIEALKLVKGRPFILPHDGYEWAVAEIEATIIKVEEAAVALTDLAFEKGDFELAVWASKKGLLTDTGYYDLLVKRGKAALLLQDAEEIVRAFADLQSSLEHGGAPEEGAPDLSSNPELAEVYNRLSSGGRGRVSPVDVT